MPKQSRPITRDKKSIDIESGASTGAGELDLNGRLFQILPGIPELDGSDEAKVQITDNDGPNLYNSGGLSHVDGATTWYTLETDVPVGGNMNKTYEKIRIICDSAQSEPRTVTVILKTYTE